MPRLHTIYSHPDFASLQNYSRPTAIMSHKNQVTVVLGAQWGDEGKGKLVDLLTENMEVVARCDMSRVTLAFGEEKIL